MQIIDGWQIACSDVNILQDSITNLLEILPWKLVKNIGTASEILSEYSGKDPFCAEYEKQDIWFQKIFNFGSLRKRWLRFESLTAPAEIFVDGKLVKKVLCAYVPHLIALPLENVCNVVVRFPSRSAWLAEKRPRPRWKTKIVNNQQLRWLRTPLFGAMTGFTPPCSPVGFLDSVFLFDSDNFLSGEFIKKHAILRSELKESTGIVTFKGLFPTELFQNFKLDCHFLNLQGLQMSLQVSGKFSNFENDQQIADGHQLESSELSIKIEGNYLAVYGQVKISRPRLWWPHTHGTPHLYKVDLLITLRSQDDLGEQKIKNLDLGFIGFRHFIKKESTFKEESVFDEENKERFKFFINGTEIFCRGACWTPEDVVSFKNDSEKLSRTLLLVCEAGMNMLRISGTMLYENNMFYELCDKFGIMVWQDFMFANMDYPFSDDVFLDLVTQEVNHFLNRTAQFCCISVLCGGSEVEQQASMLGLPKEIWQNEFFHKTLPAICETMRDSYVYFSSSPCGGALPFHTDSGVTHYYGVGAYLRPLEDARRADVNFAAECLAFANVPESYTVNNLLKNGESPVHNPLWKSRVPRDAGAGWDFEDVRDFYFQLLFKEDPMRLRYSDKDRYLKLSRMLTGQVMEYVFREFRRTKSSCAGALVWLLRDFWPGAGWGLIDSNGLPKAAYYFLKRTLQPVSVFFTDEGLNGLDLHIINEKPRDLLANISLVFLRKGEVQTAKKDFSVHLPARSRKVVRVEQVLERFFDPTWSYRFGPKNFDVAYAILDGNVCGLQVVSDCYHFCDGFLLDKLTDSLSLSSNAVKLSDGEYEISLTAKSFLQGVFFDLDGYIFSDNYFHLAPGVKKVVLAKRILPNVNFRPYVMAMNADGMHKISLPAQVNIT